MLNKVEDHDDEPRAEDNDDDARSDHTSQASDISVVGKQIKVEAQVGVDADNNLVLVLRNFPRNIDTNNIEIVNASPNVFNPADSDDDEEPKRKLKIVTIEGDSGEGRGRKNWRNTGRFSEGFRTPYTEKVRIFKNSIPG